MSEKRIITIRSGNEEVRMEVTEEEYQRYFRPWWRQKKREQRNREIRAYEFAGEGSRGRRKMKKGK